MVLDREDLNEIYDTMSYIKMVCFLLEAQDVRKKLKGDYNMMDTQLRLYTILDTTAEKFGPLYESVNDMTAARNFSQIMKRVQPEFRSEYELYFVGTWDTINGLITAENRPVKVIMEVR